MMKKSQTRIPASIWAIGFASMLLNISAVMIFGIAALYVKQILGVATGIVLLLEGFFEALAYIMKLFSGVISDYLRKRKLVMVWGFALTVIARLFFALSSSFGVLLTARILDRLGNGIQSTPRDALVGDLAPENIKGACFGLRQSLAVAGSFIGGFVGIWCMVSTNQNFQTVFAVASVPAFLGLLLVLFFVKDSHAEEVTVDKKPIRHPIHLSDLKRLGKPYWILMGIALVFMSARVGESVLVLHATGSFNLDQSFSHAILILYNVMNSLCSYPVGYLSDKFGRYGFLGLSFFILILADAFLGFAENLTTMMIGVALWGIQIGMSQSMFLSLIADHVPEDLRGTGIGFFYLISAAALLLAGGIGGIAEHMYDQFATFIVSGAISLVALLMLAVFHKTLQKLLTLSPTTKSQAYE
jgi:MFS family permease